MVFSHNKIIESTTSKALLLLVDFLYLFPELDVIPRRLQGCCSSSVGCIFFAKDILV